jgi:hypothetical protein
MTAIELIKQEIERAEVRGNVWTEALAKTEYGTTEYKNALKEQWYYMGVKHGLQSAISQIHIGG